MPKLLAQLLLCLVFASATALARVYQSTDANGNTVFSDQPLPGGVEVDINPPNVADPVTIPAAPPEPAASPEPQVQPSKQQPTDSPERTYDDDDRSDARIIRFKKRWRRIGPRHPRPNR